MRNNIRVRSMVLGVIVLLIPVAGLAMLQLGTMGSGSIASYANEKPRDPIARLQEKLDSGDVTLNFDRRWGYLPSVLDVLKIPKSTQGLVFSKTSFQIDHIGVRMPRALYFNDDVYVGWVQGGPVLEFASVDPKLGAIFYTLDQKKDGPPKFERLVEGCLVCHHSSSTEGVPGFLMRSTLTDADGNPILSAGTNLMTDRSPWTERFGGWYVTGTSGGQIHRGNSYYPGRADAIGNSRSYVGRTDFAATSNLTSLPASVDASRYLTKHSDIVALMVLAHQTQLHNLIARVSYEVPSIIRDEAMDPSNSQLTQYRIRSATEPLVQALLFAWTPEFADPIRGTSGFASEFEKLGPFDHQGRSLREMDLNKRLFRYPLSYLVYSEAFDAMPARAKEYVYRRFREILSGADKTIDFRHLTDADRKAILEILEDTKPDFKQR